MKILALIFFQYCLFSGSYYASAADTLAPAQSLRNGSTLVSPGQIFELGFFSPVNSNKYYLGIWYKRLPDTVVWVGNRENPVIDSHAFLNISSTGYLFIFDGQNTMIWSANSSRSANNPVAQLLDSGNLVVKDEDTDEETESYLWESFDFPTDTQLPGMKIGRNFKTGVNLYLRARKGVNDPSPGDFTYGIEHNGLPQFFLRAGMKKRFRGGPWNGIRFGGLPPQEGPLTVCVFVFNTEEVYRSYEVVDKSVIMRFTVNESGLLERRVLYENTSEWTTMFTLQNDKCDDYAQCGPNGVCKIKQRPICECLEGFIPRSEREWRELNWTGGCVRSTPLDCRKREGFLQVENVKLPDLLDFKLDNRLNLEDCRAECLKNCSCTAYARSNYNGSGCLMWFGELTDIREFIVEQFDQNIYVRLPASEVELHSNKEDLELPLFDFVTIASATNNFSDSNKIGTGGFGLVYKGELFEGQEIAVKRLSSNSRQGVEHFKNEVAMISKLQHRNLVRLLGYCIKRDERMLIYEFMPNRSLNYFIFDETRRNVLTWPKRFEIIMGISRGLLYLHQDSRLRIIHRDLKTSNVLLDNELNPKISDFGIAKMFGGDQVEAKTKRVFGTYGYMSPEYAIDGKFSVKSDVFSLGVLLLEIVSGKRNRGFNHPDHYHNLLGHAWLLWNDEKAMELMDRCSEDSCVEEQVVRCILVGLLCVQKHVEDRPTMSCVVRMLDNEEIATSLPRPKEPGFYVERSSGDTNAVGLHTQPSTENALTLTQEEGR
ncbi:G-type lectin S-receptor-like serine/threonine-protein kinase [Hibiscus syriacus]|uniref:Receptor-like serine/threonine-protein kinase n=1 Tax=Hibiscus syriacus TaxID=106335 RepID=A0A6A2ZLP3_HIBSY|nr:G-type lectin S-receptor-like serine/threonine-protein kinase At4g27290 [Hibiscus syriacus]KAE8692219.1 G-type lectin S-receptor-like serine/threonine-protein kinase [Hibiscus syriacus]